jgi:hypothetical protein
VFNDLNGLHRVPKGGGPVDDVDIGEVVGFAVDEQWIYWVEMANHDEIVRTRLEPGAPAEVVAIAADVAIPVLVDESCVYLSLLYLDRVDRFPKEGGRMSILFQGSVGADVAKDATHFYWTEYQAGRVMAASK